MEVSLNEIDTMVRKACMGAGHSVGLAEELGQACRWLVAHGVNGAEAAVGMLHASPAQKAAKPWVWQADKVELGEEAFLSDYVSVLDYLEAGRARSVSVGRVHSAPILLGLTAVRSRTYLPGFVIEGACKTSFVLNDGRAYGSGSAGAFFSDKQDWINIAPYSDKRLEDENIYEELSSSMKFTAAPSDWQTLKEWANLLLVAASDQSRLKGAGAGLTDND